MCDKIILENGGMIRFIPDCCKNKNCDIIVDNYSNGLEFARDCYKPKKMCDKAVDTNLPLM